MMRHLLVVPAALLCTSVLGAQQHIVLLDRSPLASAWPLEGFGLFSGELSDAQLEQPEWMLFPSSLSVSRFGERFFDEEKIEPQLPPRIHDASVLEACLRRGGYEGEVFVAGSRLLLRGSRAFVDRGEGLWQLLERSQLPVRLRYSVHRGILENVPDTHIPAADVEQLRIRLARLPLLLDGRSDRVPGKMQGALRVRHEPFVKDQVAEFSQMVGGVVPVVDQLDFRKRLLMQVQRDPSDGHLHLFVRLLAQESEGPVRPAQVGEGLLVEYAANRGLRYVTSTTLARGESLLLQIPSEKGGYSVLLQPEDQSREETPRVQQSDARRAGDFELVPAGLLLGRGLAARSTIWAKRPELENEDGIVSLHGSNVLLQGNDAETDARRAALLSRSALESRRAVLVVQAECRPLEGGVAWTPFGKSVRLEALHERSAICEDFGFLGYTPDFNVAVTASTRISVPDSNIATSGRGIAMSWSATSEGDEFVLHIVERVVHAWRGLPSLPMCAGMSAQEESRAVLSRRMVLAPGESRLLGDGALRVVDGKEHRVRYRVQRRRL